MIWSIRLFKKGKKLVENDSDKGFMREAAKIAVKDNPLIDNHLYKLAKVPFIYYVNTCNFCLFSMQNICLRRGVMPGSAGGLMAPPNFGRSVNPISTREDRLCPPNYY